jgi:hypothetical protein
MTRSTTPFFLFWAGLIATPVDTDSTVCFPFVVKTLDGRTMVFQTRSLEKRAKWLSWLRAASERCEMPDRTQPGAVQFISRERAVGEEVSAGAGGGCDKIAGSGETLKTRWSTSTHQFFHSSSFKVDVLPEPYDASKPSVGAVGDHVGRAKEPDVRNTGWKLELL